MSEPFGPPWGRSNRYDRWKILMPLLAAAANLKGAVGTVGTVGSFFFFFFDQLV